MQIIIPAAGYGTRLLPVTKAVPKELLPLITKPAIQEIVEEGVRSGIQKFCIVISDEKRAIKEYFTHNERLTKELESVGRAHLIESINHLIAHCSFSYVMQPEMRGLGHAILMAKPCIQEAYVSVMLPDDIIIDPTPCMKQLLTVALKEQATVIAVMEVPCTEISAYGSIRIGKQLADDLCEVSDIIEKPKPHEAFSNRAIVGRYVLSRDIFDELELLMQQGSREIQLTDALVNLTKRGHRVLAYTIKGKRFDLGNPLGFLQALLYLSLQSSDYSPHIHKLFERNL